LMICRVLAAEIFERFAYLLSLSMTMSSRFYLCYASQDPFLKLLITTVPA